VVVAGDAIAVRWMVNICLSFDHRALDGFEAGGFLATLKKRLESAG
jgi:pyruvate/2-oxoglutarate dehydrogenase complex dihydrolipoamide acyltransferase (E2) component